MFDFPFQMQMEEPPNVPRPSSAPRKKPVASRKRKFSEQDLQLLRREHQNTYSNKKLNKS